LIVSVKIESRTKNKKKKRNDLSCDRISGELSTDCESQREIHRDRTRALARLWPCESVPAPRNVEVKVDCQSSLNCLKKIAVSDRVFGCFVERVLIDISTDRDSSDPQVPALQRLLTQEEKLTQLKLEIQRVADENEKLAIHLAELKLHTKRRRREMKELETVLREKSDVFTQQRQLHNRLNELFKFIEDPIEVKEEVKASEAPQIMSLKLHNESLTQQIKAFQRNIEIAQNEIEMIEHLR
jgi:hypothetical protein